MKYVYIHLHLVKAIILILQTDIPFFLSVYTDILSLVINICYKEKQYYFNCT